MSDIELVIKIPDHLYKLLKDFPSDSNETTIENVLMKAVENGTPLPKEYGRMIDADELKRELINKEWITDNDGGGLENIVDEAPTIIEAEKG